MGELDLVALAHAIGGGGPLAYTVKGEDGGFLERRWEEGAGGVGLVVIGEDVSTLELLVEAAVHLAGRNNFCRSHRGMPAMNDLNPIGRVRQVGFEQAFEFDEGFVVEGNVVEITGADTALLQAEVDSVLGEAVIMLFARKPLF